MFCTHLIERRNEIMSVIPYGIALPPPTGLPMMIRYMNTTCGHQLNANTNCGVDLNSFKERLTQAVQDNNLQQISDLQHWYTRKVQRDSVLLHQSLQMEVDNDPMNVEEDNMDV